MTIEELNLICKNTFIDLLGMHFLNFDGTCLTAELQVTPAHLQPTGFVHGGVYISMAESVAGAASMLLLKDDGKIPFGVTVNSQHLASISEGKIVASGKLVYEGTLKHIWDVKITNPAGKLISISRVTNNIKKTEKSE